MQRRTALTSGVAGLAALGLGSMTSAAAATEGSHPNGGGPRPPSPREFRRLVDGHPEPPPAVEFAFAAVVDIAPTQAMGEGPLGERRIVPILGGRFEGPQIKGRVVPGGADRQLVRRDGVRMLSAQYELQTDDGAWISVLNSVLIDGDGASRYARSTIELTAPAGPHEWLNRRRFVGTLTSLRPEREAVLIRCYALV